MTKTIQPTEGCAPRLFGGAAPVGRCERPRRLPVGWSPDLITTSEISTRPSSRGRPFASAVLILLLACLAAGPVVPRALRAQESARAVVQETADQVVAVLENKPLSADQKRHQIEQIVYAHFDFDVLSRLVLARNWTQLSAAQQKEFVEEFKKHLSLTYGKNVETYNGERAVITGERPEARGDTTVKTKVVRPHADDVLVDYRLRQENGRWQVIDVVIEGVSLVANFRSQFQEIIANGGPEHLLQLLREKNSKGEPLKS
jgi:phospholipid transport system substrate-binding protein